MIEVGNKCSYFSFRPDTSSNQIIRKLQEKLKAAHIERRKQRNALNKVSSALDKYRQLFSVGIRKRIESGTMCDLNEDDKSFCIALESMGQKAYNFLRASGFPLPHPSTLRGYTSKFDLQPGFLEVVLPVLSNKANDLGKLVVICFDEMKLRRCYEFDPSTNTVVRPADQVLVFMVKGLCNNYQQVIYYNYDEKPTRTVIDMIVEKLEGCGLRPVALVCDQGTKNVALFKQMNVSMERPYYSNRTGNKLFVFVDTPHLIKSLRNNLLDSGYIVRGQPVTAAPIIKIVEAQHADIKIAHKLTKDHFPPPRHVRRQKVSLAAQIFSNSTSAGIRRLVQLSKLKPNTYNRMPLESEATADFLKQINDYFDIMNVYKCDHDSRPTKRAYGFRDALERQNEVLVDVHNTIMNTRRIGWTALLPCQKGVLQNIRGLMGLLDYLRSSSDLTYIITRRLNQDELERLFGYLRSKGGGLNDHPSALQFKYRLRKSMLGKTIM